MNKKGFAISVVLYAMVILIIGVLYLLLGIVKNRYMVGDNLKYDIINTIPSVDVSDPVVCTDWKLTDYAYVKDCEEVGSKDTGVMYTMCELRYRYRKSQTCGSKQLSYTSKYYYPNSSSALSACKSYNLGCTLADNLATPPECNASDTMYYWGQFERTCS